MNKYEAYDLAMTIVNKMNNPIMSVGKQLLTADNEYLCKQLEPVSESTPVDEVPKEEEKEPEKPKEEEFKPKFNIGDFVVTDYCMGRIVEITSDAYLLDTGQGIPFSCEHNAHIWNIQDAKEGDILACESGWTCIFKTLVNDETFSSYCFIDKTKWFCETGSECHTLNEEFAKAYNGEIKPATKEQCDLLLQKMKEAGYMWDSESKQLLSLKTEPCDKQNSANLEEFINELSKQFPDVSFAKLSRIAVRVAKWAKPTDEEMKELLRTEYEKGRADVIAETQKPSTIDIDEMVSDYANNKKRGNEEFGKPVPCMVRAYRQGLNDAVGKVVLKPAWSEEDENRINHLIAYFEDKELFTAEDDIVYANWLKSLKDRIGG